MMWRERLAEPHHLSPRAVVTVAIAAVGWRATLDAGALTAVRA